MFGVQPSDCRRAEDEPVLQALSLHTCGPMPYTFRFHTRFSGLPMKAQDIIELQEPRLSSFESMFIPAVLVGLGTTIRHLGQTLRGTHRTMQYPEEGREQ